MLLKKLASGIANKLPKKSTPWFCIGAVLVMIAIFLGLVQPGGRTSGLMGGVLFLASLGFTCLMRGVLLTFLNGISEVQKEYAKE